MVSIKRNVDIIIEWTFLCKAPQASDKGCFSSKTTRSKLKMLHQMTILLIEQFQRYASLAIATAAFVINDFSKSMGFLHRFFQLTTVSGP